MITIPEGWREMQPGELLIRGDKRYAMDTDSWHLTGHKTGTKLELHMIQINGLHIRQVHVQPIMI